MLIFPFRVCYKEPVERRRAERGGRQTDGDDRQERMDERPLSALRPGDRATIGRLEGGGPIRRRLLELGLTPGTGLTLVRLAPLRDPMEIRVRGYQLCVRRSEADAVWVRVEPARPAVILSGVAPARRCGAAPDGGHRGQLLQEARFRLRGQSEEIPAGCQWLYSAAAELISLGSSGAVAASSAEATRSSYAAS